MTYRTYQTVSLLAVIFLVLGTIAEARRPLGSKSSISETIADPAEGAADSSYVDDSEACADDAAVRAQEQFVIKIAVTAVILVGAIVVFIPGLRQAIRKGTITVDRRADGASSSYLQTYTKRSAAFWWVCVQYVLFLVAGLF